MTFTQWLRQTFGSQGQVARAPRRGKSRQATRLRFVPRLDLMEERLAPAILAVNSLLDNSTANDSMVTLREAISASVNRTTTDLGQTGDGTDTIQFSSAIDGGTIKLTNFVNDLAAGSTMPGPSALRINNSTMLTLDGATGLTQGVTIARDTTAAAFRLFYIASDSDLTIQGLTLQGGLAKGGKDGSFFAAGGGGAAGLGGAFFNDGNLRIQNSTLAGNNAQGGAGGAGQDGAQGSGGGGLCADGKDLSSGLPENGGAGGAPMAVPVATFSMVAVATVPTAGAVGADSLFRIWALTSVAGRAAMADSAVAGGAERVQAS